MNTSRFDALSRALSTPPSRRGVLRAVAGLAVTARLGGLAGVAGTTAKKKHKKKKHKKRKRHACARQCDGRECGDDGCGGTCGSCNGNETCENGGCVAVATCSDGQQNGDETDVDCGGSCPRCGNGKSCNNRDDCASAFCVNGACGSCNGSAQCGSDSHGNCFCEQIADGSSACNSAAEIVSQPATCGECDPGLNCLDLGSQVACVKPCGAP